jgi:hypothetical protein
VISTFTWASVPASFIMLVAFLSIYFNVRLSAKHARVGEVGGETGRLSFEALQSGQETGCLDG